MFVREEVIEMDDEDMLNFDLLFGSYLMEFGSGNYCFYYCYYIFY